MFPSGFVCLTAALTVACYDCGLTAGSMVSLPFLFLAAVFLGADWRAKRRALEEETWRDRVTPFR